MTVLMVTTKKQAFKSNHIKSKYEVIRDSLKIVTKEYCLESSICGLKHLVNTGTSDLERWIWMLTMIGALICSVSLVWVTFDKYYKTPLVTTQLPEGISVNDIVFPAIGICSTNRISKRAVSSLARRLLQEDRNKMYNEDEMLSLLSGLGQMYNFHVQEDSNLEPLHRALGKYDMKEILREVTPRCEDLLLMCAWNEAPKNCTDIFDFRLTMNGYCCTFNYLRVSDDLFTDISNSKLDMYNHGNKSSFDIDQGLKTIVKFDDSDDFFYNFHLKGAVLQFSDSYDFPDAPSGSFATLIISPTLLMTVLVSASLTLASRDIQHVPIAHRGCLFYDESPYLLFYTHSDCMLKCRMLFLMDKCDCTPFNMPKMKNTRTCDLSDIVCLRTFYAQSTTVRPDIQSLSPELEAEFRGGIPCPMCHPTCSKTAYSYNFQNVNIYPDYLNAQPDKNRDDWMQGINFTGTSIVHVRYSSEVAKCYEQNVIMKWFDLFSNIGSTCGFVTGFSFVSVLEFFYYFVVKFLRQIKEDEDGKRQVGLQQTSRLKKQRSLYWDELTRNVLHKHIEYNI